uniref:Meiosis initiator n=1 Tax=Marmota marmota marmota TaxID=9994 RepID=A0A8C5ZM20_MARMA
IWGSDYKFNFGCPNQIQLSSQTRNQKKNHSSKLQELALLLPVAPKTGTKKLTKKEILLHVLHYIQYLQRSIDVAKALLKFHTSDGEGGLGEQRRSPTEPYSGVVREHSLHTGSSDTHLSAFSERQTRDQKPRRSLALDKPEKTVTTSPDQKEGNVGGITTPPRCPDPWCDLKAAFASFQGDGEGGRSQLTLLDIAENIVLGDITLEGSHSSSQLRALCLPLNSTCHRQKLVFCDSSEEVDKEVPDADPWLPAWTPEGSPYGSPVALGPPQINNWSVTGHPSEILGLSPSLFSSPGKLLPEQILEDGLFEEVLLEPESRPSACTLEAPQKKSVPLEAPEAPPDSHSLCQSSVSLDHCYLSLSEASKVQSSPSTEESDLESLWGQEEVDPEGLQSSSDEDDDYTWTPTRRASTLPTGGRKSRKGRTSKGPSKPKESKKAPCPTQMKKKCVNGFIMFCRMNRKQYIRACPGTASTAATKELAQLWRVMTPQERRPYCIKARRFSRQHNRIVKQENSSSEDEDWETPKPFYQLLAEKAHSNPDLPPLPPLHPQ